MAEEREELVGGAHPKKIKAGTCCVLLAACGFIWRPRNLKQPSPNAREAGS